MALPAVAIAVWARWNAPRSARRLPPDTRIPLELAVCATAALGLVVAGAVTWAVVCLAIFVVNAGLLTVLRQWEARAFRERRPSATRPRWSNRVRVLEFWGNYVLLG